MASLIIFFEVVRCEGEIGDSSKIGGQTMLMMYPPTAEEIQSGFVEPAFCSWGENIRNERALRWLVLGGSNSFPNKLQQPDRVYHRSAFHKIMELYPYLNTSASYLLDKSMSGSAMAVVLTKLYDFEMSNDEHDWPNLITIEYSVNGFNAKTLDQIIYIFKYRYRIRGFKPPAFLYIDVFTRMALYVMASKRGLQPNCSKVEKLSVHNANPNAGATKPASQVARFYGFPMLSMTEASKPYFFRFFMNNPLTASWPYEITGDHSHFNELGHDFISEKLLLPFLQRELARQCSDKDDRPPATAEGTRRMFPTELSVMPIRFWNCWGPPPHDFHEIMDSASTGWVVTGLRNHRNDHECYASTSKKDVLRLRFDLPSICSGNDRLLAGRYCEVQFFSIYSWDAGYLGNMEVRLSNGERKLETVLIRANHHGGEPVKDTTHRSIKFRENLGNGTFVIDVEKLDNKLTFACSLGVVVHLVPDLL